MAFITAFWMSPFCSIINNVTILIASNMINYSLTTTTNYKTVMSLCTAINKSFLVLLLSSKYFIINFVRPVILFSRVQQPAIFTIIITCDFNDKSPSSDLIVINKVRSTGKFTHMHDMHFLLKKKFNECKFL